MSKSWLGWIVGVVITVTAGAIMTARYYIPNLIWLELAPDAETMTKYVLAIAPTANSSYHILQMNTIIDYFFITGYSLLTFFSFKILLEVFEAPIWGWVYVLSGITGFFDILENNFLWNSALRHHEDFSCLYYYIVRIKWACAIIPLMIIPVALIYGILLLTSLKQQDKRIKPDPTHD